MRWQCPTLRCHELAAIHIEGRVRTNAKSNVIHRV